MPEKIEINGESVQDVPTEVSSGKLLVILSNNVAYLTHTIHKYPAKFIPHIPRWAISKYLHKQSSLVLDPFCGSGTTLVEALVSHQNSIGIDIDPLSALISKVKTTPIPREKLHSVIDELKQSIKSQKTGQFIPKIKTLNHWFSEGNIRELSIIRDCIEKYRDDTDIYDFLIITFSSVIRKASNADNQTQKTYVSHTLTKVVPPATPLFFRNLDLYSRRVNEQSELVDSRNFARVFRADSRQTDSLWKVEKLPEVDLVVTSPPYIKAIDYIYNQMAEYFWIGDLFNLETQPKQNDFKRSYIGTKQIKATDYQSLPKTSIEDIDLLASEIAKKNMKHGYIVAKFFNDMKLHFKSVHKTMRKDAHYIMVIGNNTVSGLNVPSHGFIRECAEEAGFSYCNHFGYSIRNRYMRFPRSGRGGIIKEDWVLDFAK